LLVWQEEPFSQVGAVYKESKTTQQIIWIDCARFDDRFSPSGEWK
jgi:hypothetical protein